MILIRIVVSVFLLFFFSTFYGETNDKSGIIQIDQWNADDKEKGLSISESGNLFDDNIGDDLSLEEALNSLITNHLDPDVFFDLGVVNYQNNKLGESILNFKRAYLLAPNDSEIREALFAVRESLGMPAFLYESSPLVKVFLFPFTVFNLNTMAWIGLIFTGLGMAGLGVLFISKSLDKDIQKKIKITTIIALAIGGVYLISSLIRYRVVFDMKQAVIMDDTDIYVTISQDEIVDNVEEGMECVIIETNQDYAHIETVSGDQGWIKSDTIERVWCLYN